MAQIMKSRVYELFALSSEWKREAEKFKRLVEASETFLISSTLTSDGDSIGSQIGILDLIRRLKGPQFDDKNVWIVNQSPVPRRYQFLSETNRILTTEEFQKDTKKPATFQVGIFCDGGVERTGNVESLVSGIRDLVLVDHHAVGSERSYAANLLDLESSSTCELVYHLYDYFGYEVSREIAEHLFVGIIFDTGFFKHSITKPRTHAVAAKLIQTGIDFSAISDRALLDRTWSAQQLLKVLFNNMELSLGGRVISSIFSLAETDPLNLVDGDQEGMINQLYSTVGVEVVVLFTEKDATEVKISFRSKNSFNVAAFARRLDPNGGGHVRASGCSLKGSLADVKARVLRQLHEELAAHRAS